MSPTSQHSPPRPFAMMRDITELPHDLFLLVIGHLSPRTCVVCRSVSRRWLSAFTNDANSLLLLRWNFPRCREMRLLADSRRNLVGWAATFADVARRYHNLRLAQPRTVEKLELAVSTQGNTSSFSFLGIATWNRFLRLEAKTAEFHYPDPVWWYSQEDSVLVYPAEDIRAEADQRDGHVYQVLDLSTGNRVPVPFDIRQKHIRRVRLAEGVLVFEWAEALPYHQLNDREVVHRHFVTTFDVYRTRSDSETSTEGAWTVEFRSEWKLHFLGLPLNRSDRFFSAHTTKHYAVYFWQPNRSLYQDDPIEQLAVWDISSPSSYRPSQDPQGGKRPAPSRAQTTPTGLWSARNNTSSVRVSESSESIVPDRKALTETLSEVTLAAATAGPQVIRRMAWRELDFYSLRQRANPQLRNLRLDDHNLYVVEEEHRWADGQHSSLNPPRVHAVRCTGIPIIPTQAATQSTAASSARPDDTPPKSRTITNIVDGPVFGPVWVDECGADGDVTMCFCRRISSNTTPSSAPPSPTHNILDDTATLENLNLPPRPRDTLNAWPWTIGHSERYAPCWRHEEFPYLTVSEMLDADAGVRITARHCFMLETLSVHVRPAMISVRGAAGATSANDDEVPTRKNRKGNGKKRASGQTSASRTGEVQFLDAMWSELMAKGHIAGDERWIVGEDQKGFITVVRF
ncbi:hypothetical protein QBC34DRAFT_392128 [Podospora aff. communis PSN243]|uniref:F-box domain-containing protein n=1 Tax=Podospora aff. communis PSN243 TaxID=3040156 RepID=A0AAV9H4H1_9PEZI|nr:hypothetical protein QBC34DRAFT_392128 [Podospora aff. communis PSN243]